MLLLVVLLLLSPMAQDIDLKSLARFRFVFVHRSKLQLLKMTIAFIVERDSQPNQCHNLKWIIVHMLPTHSTLVCECHYVDYVGWSSDNTLV